MAGMEQTWDGVPVAPVADGLRQGGRHIDLIGHVWNQVPAVSENGR